MLTFALIGIFIIIIIIFLLTLPKNIIQKEDPIITKIKNVLIVFNYKIVQIPAEKFEQSIVFKTPSDIIGNMMTFIDYAFPLINIANIEKLLIENGINKSVKQIFDENKNLDFEIFKNKFKISTLLYIYTYYFYRGTEEELRKNIRLYLLIEESYKHIINKYNLLKEGRISNTGTYDLVLNNDYMTSEIITVYLRTNANKNISLSNAEENNNELMPEVCFNTKLCTHLLYIYDIIARNRQYIGDNLPSIERLFNLIFIKYLCNLNNTNFIFDTEVIRLSNTELRFINYNNITYESTQFG